MPSFSDTERAILDALARHTSQGEDVTLPELARECHVSKSTVVRVMKKLGYRGYRDFEHTFRVGGPQNKQTLLPRRPIAGSYDDAARELAQALTRAVGRKNIMYSGGSQEAAYLASYMSRKLALFNIFAPASYDYAMFDTARLEAGCVFFFQHWQGPDASHVDSQALHAAREQGFEPVVIAHEEAVSLNHAALFIPITPDEAPLDLFMPKVIMLFERALELFAASQTVEQGNVNLATDAPHSSALEGDRHE